MVKVVWNPAAIQDYNGGAEISLDFTWPTYRGHNGAASLRLQFCRLQQIPYTIEHLRCYRCRIVEVVWNPAAIQDYNGGAEISAHKTEAHQGVCFNYYRLR